MSLLAPAASSPAYRRWCANPGQPGEWVEVAEPMICEFFGFKGLVFVSHRWVGELYSVFEVSTGFGVDGVLDPKEAYPTRGAATDAAEMELRHIGPAAFTAAVIEHLRMRGGAA